MNNYIVDTHAHLDMYDEHIDVIVENAIQNGVNRVHILDGRIPHCLLLEIFTNHGIGTAIVKD